MRNNKGFSLVELIIVIAIMAILIGVMAPQLIKYIEKTNVSSDTQLCDSVKTAVTTAIMDPAVINANDSSVPTFGTTYQLANLTTSNTFNDAVAETLGYSGAPALANINNEIKSAHGAGGIKFQVTGSNQVCVWIANSDASGKKTTTYADQWDKVIFVD